MRIPEYAGRPGGRTGAGDDVVGRAALNALGFVDGSDVLADGLEERFESRAMSLLRRLSRGEALLYFLEVGFKGC